ncbi:hypothetical protein RBH26_09005 [Natronolimnohabitans sp. A-GB9]|uniref:hypothetical protein n=1 Tax=Natronolimnohabitans sp. A-GB9 TaxID=3069757 RepID=UPI0027AF0ED5|nr:hypothetical protein [Natronolimnohabitans sp. A-GB9]MDQ2050625.1 hypothetical protein [Natronolimnohabitans sp. A-GB9]
MSECHSPDDGDDLERRVAELERTVDRQATQLRRLQWMLLSLLVLSLLLVVYPLAGLVLLLFVGLFLVLDLL